MSDQQKEMQAATAEESVRKNDAEEELSSEAAATATKVVTTTTTAPPAGRVRGRNRRRVVSDDDDEDEDDKTQNQNKNKDVKVTDVKDEVADNGDGNNNDDDDDDKPRRGAGRLKAASAAKIRAAALSAPVVPPVAPPKIPSALHVDPSTVNNNNNNNSSNNNNSAQGVGSETTRAVGGSKVRFAIPEPHAAAMYNVEMVYKMDFDALTYVQMLKIISCITPHQVENKLAQREQEVQLIRQQKQSQRVEHFLDFYTNAAMSNGTNTSHNNNNNNNNNGYSNEEATTLTSSSSSTAHNNGTDNNTDDAAAATAVNGSSSCLAQNADGQTKVINMSGYTYNVMLSRLYDALNRSHEGSAMTQRNQLPTPIMEKIGKKKTVISNFGRICKAFHREMDDVKDFIEKELSITGNLDSNNALILKYEIRKATDFDNILVKYLEQYVKCNACHRIDTTLTKEGRRTELKCNWCTATRTVQAMGTATFRAALEKRSRQRATLTL